MKLSITCFDPIVLSVLRVNGWAGAVDSEDLPLLESILKSKGIPAIIVMEGDRVLIRVKWGRPDD